MESALQMNTSASWHADVHADNVMKVQDASPEERHWQPEGVGNMRRVRYLSRLLRGLDALKAARIWTNSDTHRRTAMLSAGGPGSGVMWQLQPRECELLENGHFRAAFCIRLAAIDMLAGSTCHYQRANDSVPLAQSANARAR